MSTSIVEVKGSIEDFIPTHGLYPVKCNRTRRATIPPPEGRKIDKKVTNQDINKKKKNEEQVKNKKN